MVLVASSLQEPQFTNTLRETCKIKSRIVVNQLLFEFYMSLVIAR